jgi:hypothetical protein
MDTFLLSTDTQVSDNFERHALLYIQVYFITMHYWYTRLARLSLLMFSPASKERGGEEVVRKEDRMVRVENPGSSERDPAT